MATDPFDSSQAPQWEVSAEMVASLLGLQLAQGGNQQRPVLYETNTPAGFELGLRRNGLGGSLGFQYGKRKDEIDVSTHSLDLQLFLHQPRAAADLYFQTYQGYFVRGEGPRQPIALPNMRISTQTANVYLKILGNLDLTSLSSPGSLPSAASWLQYASISVSRRTASSSQPLAPPFAAPFYETLRNADELDVLVPSLSVGWLASFRHGSAYFSPGVGIGFGYPFLLSGDHLAMHHQLKMNMRIMTGSDSPSGGWGLQFIGDIDGLVLRSEENVSFMSGKARLFKNWKF